MSATAVQTILQATLPISEFPQNSGKVTVASIDGPTLPVSPNLTQVKVFPNLDVNPHGTQLQISWPAQRGAVSYNVYVSPSPTSRNFYMTVPSSQLLVTFTPSITLPNEIVWMMWVEVNYGGGVLKFIQDEPSYLEENSAFDVPTLSEETEALEFFDQGEMKFYVEEIRRRHKAILENDAEPFYLYLRRWIGVPCYKCQTEGTGNFGQGVGTPIDANSGEPFGPAVNSGDPDYQAGTMCPICYGTGIMGGYFPKLQVMCRYGDMPLRHISYGKNGLSIQQDFNSWTLWFPRLHEHDFIVRQRTGERFRAKEVMHAAWRGICTRQLFTAAAIPSTDIVYAVTDAGIQIGIDASSEFDSGARFDWSCWK